MCESKVFIREGDREELLMDEVAHMRVSGNSVILSDIMGRRRVVSNVKVLYIDFLRHKVVLQSLGGSK